jgi:osmoprotectant transport system substrate-binding protein
MHKVPPIAVALSLVSALACSACGVTTSGTQTGAGQTATTTTSSSPSSSSPSSTSPTSTGTGTGTGTITTSTTATLLPGTGRPTITIGDKNYTEQFLLGELYKQALTAEGFSVNLNQNIGPTDVTLQALKTGSLAMYPEYLNVFNSAIAKYTQPFRTRLAAYHAAERYATANGLDLLAMTPFSDTGAIGVTVGYAQANHLRSLADLSRVQSTLTLGGPPELEPSTPGPIALEQTYGFTPHAFTSLPVGSQYSALDNGSVQAAELQTTDGQLASGDYQLLADPANAFGWGNVVPVVSAAAVEAEGPAFGATINRVSALLTTGVMRQLNAAVDVSGQNPATVAQQFLETHGVIPPSSG